MTQPQPYFADCPNVRTVIARLVGANPTYDLTDEQTLIVNAACDRIGQILFGEPGYMGTGLLTARIARHHP